VALLLRCRIFWDRRPDHKSDISLAEYKLVIKLFVAAAVGCQGAPKTEFLRLFASESTANTPRTHYNTLLAPPRSVVLPVNSLATFGKSPAARGSRNGPRTPPERRSAAGTALGRNWGALPWGGGCLAGWCWCVGVGGGLASRLGARLGLSGVQ
jgi:hypothetical protein